jgi:hypothetical protein
MNDAPSNGEAARLAACRACGNRVARSARRCPACGEREPAGAGPEAPAADQAPARPASGRRGQIRGLVLAAVVGAVAASLVAAVLRPAPRPPAEPRPEAPAVAPAPPREAPAATPAAPVPSRSRGRTDWLFFFKPGDQLTRMTDDTPLGMVIRTERAHTFPDGTGGPAYLLQVPEGGQRFMDADELERGARLQ